MFAQRTEVRRWDLVWELLPYPVLAACALMTLADGPGWSLALAAALAGWHWWWVTAHPAWPGRLLPMAVYGAGLLALLWVLVRREPVFLVGAASFSAMAFVALPGFWAYPGVLLLAATTTLADRDLTPLDAVPALVWTLLVWLVGAMLRVMESHAVRRREMVDQLNALSAENAALQERLLAQAREAGAREERQRLAGEIHDTVAQGLVAIVTQVEAALAAGPAESARLHTIRGLARDSLTEARRSMAALRPGPLAAGELPDALRGAVARWSALTGVAADVTVTGEPRRLDPDTELTLLRAVQEGLANAGRHADAGRVGVTLSYVDDEVLLDVRDDGAGFEGAGFGPGANGGFGLAAMRQRVARLAGTVTVESAPGEGTALSVRLPAGE